jgi:hypothetical protein
MQTKGKTLHASVADDTTTNKRETKTHFDKTSLT